jgi:hypothetical protein
MSEQVHWFRLTKEQRNKLIAERVMHRGRVRDHSLLPSGKKVPEYTSNLHDALLILLTFNQTQLTFQTEIDLGRITVCIEDVEISRSGGAAEECAEGICVAALQALGVEVLFE